ncbi:MAG: hypothetical protein EA390_00710 [Balneolaceae bacterium]|nr:MAG: hypothetical protein EA390_00710 [Balneolaceae bacterium]
MLKEIILIFFIIESRRSEEGVIEYRTDPKLKIATFNKSGSAGNFLGQCSGREGAFFKLSRRMM